MFERRPGQRFAFLFGAGASTGAGDVSPYPPPLGPDLYARLQSDFPQTWGSLSSDENELFQRDFETGMSEIWAAGTDLRGSGLLIDMARYFTQFDPPSDNSDCYSRLIRGLSRGNLVSRTGIATLNYECILEVAATRQGLKIDCLGPEPRPGTLLIWKPHGSCNIVADAGVYGLNIVANDYFDGGVRALDLPEVRSLYDSGYALPPAMSLFAPGKHTPVAKSFVDRARKEWAAWVRRADVVAVIGARPLFADSHVWDPIAESPAQVWYIGGLDGFELLRERQANAVHLAERFVEGITDIERNLQAVA